MQDLDIQLFFLINHVLSNPVFDLLMPVLTFQGYLLIIPLLPYLIYRGAAQKHPSGRTYFAAAVAAIAIALISFSLADFLGGELKDILARPRPCHEQENVRLLVACPKTFSLPSSHAITSFAFASPLFLLTRPFLPLAWRLYPLLLAALVAFSRPYVGVHYVSDILAGALFGAAVAFLFCVLYLRLLSRKKGRSGDNSFDSHA
jgi:undecaprenyl-diphosphatase